MVRGGVKTLSYPLLSEISTTHLSSVYCDSLQSTSSNKASLNFFGLMSVFAWAIYNVILYQTDDPMNNHAKGEMDVLCNFKQDSI